MRPAGVSLCFVFVCLLVGAAPSVAAKRHRAPAGCSRAVGQPVTADAQAQVYAVSSAGSPRVSYWGCAFGRRQSYQLGHAVDGTATAGRVFAVAGPVVAYTTIAPATATAPETLKLIVLNLKTGQMMHHQSFPPWGEASSIVVKEDGAAAWITPNREERQECHPLGTACYYIETVEANGAGTFLAVGSNIEPTSLALAGSTLYWMQGSKPHSASLN
jgi:hypothetical protein